MWRSATSSEPGPTARALLAVVLATLLAAPATSKVLRTVETALDLAFPGCEIERETVFLSEAQMAAVVVRSGVSPASALATRYLARREGKVVGTAYFDTHRVRTLDETLMVVVDPGGTVVHVEVISFAEPTDYLPRKGWYRQFDGKALDAELALDRRIHAVTGATLSAEAATSAVRRVLGLHQAIETGEEGP
jgi:hypothetical protein